MLVWHHTNALLAFSVAGIPRAQGSKTGFVRNGRVVMLEGSSAKAHNRLKKWRALISSLAAGNWGEREPIDEPVELRVTFFFERPKSHLLKSGKLHRLMRIAERYAAAGLTLHLALRKRFLAEASSP